MRKANAQDAEVLLRLYEIRREPELRRARKWFLTEFRPGEWSEIKARYLTHSDEDRWFRMTVSYWEMVGTLIAHGVLHAELYFDHTGEHVVTWEKCKSWIAGARADLRPTYLYRFEAMVNQHLEYRKRTNAAFLAAAGKQSSGKPASRAAGAARKRATRAR
jgi:hypothetical protein